MEIIQELTEVNYNKGNNKKNEYIVVHYVGAVSTAKNNADYFKTKYRGASANYFVDETSIYQVVKDENIAWHCGAFFYKHKSCRNNNSIGIEMCCYMNGDELDISDTVVNKTIELVKELMKKYNIPVENVLRHYDVTGKNCPAPFVSDDSRWAEFKDKLVPQKKKIDCLYRTYDNKKKCWLPKVKNTDDHAGNLGNTIGGLQVYTYGGGTTKIRVHVKGGKWLPEVKDGGFKDGNNNYAGIKGKAIDGVMIWSQYGDATYRVHIKGSKWLPWVKGYNTNDAENGYAGILGKEIDAIQVVIK